MRLSQLLSRTSKQLPHDEVSVNAKLLTRAGFIDKVAAGIYSYLPLGQRVLGKISNIVREEMNAIGGQEVTMPVLHPKANWEKTGRWKGFDVLFKVKGHSGEFAMGPSHEEIAVPLTQKFVLSYADLPRYVYQIQTKFRDEPRAKSGLLRGREFLMKDFYSFHTDEKDMMAYYNKMRKVYTKTLKRLGLETIETKAAGGTFSKFSHEYQVICESGEDEIVYCPGGDFAENAEITKVRENKQCDLGHGPLKKVKTIEVGNIFPLKDKFSKAFDFNYVDRQGRKRPVLMGCYGIGISRLMGAIVEVYHDERGIIWPESVAPFNVQLVHIEDSPRGEAGPGTEPWVQETYEKLIKVGIEVLWDDRRDTSAGEKFADADLIGVPTRLVVSKKVGKGRVEIKARSGQKTEIVPLEKMTARLS